MKGLMIRALILPIRGYRLILSHWLGHACRFRPVAPPIPSRRRKLALLDAIPEGQPITIYRQEAWTDHCRGPHIRDTDDAGAAFKLTQDTPPMRHP